MEPSKRMQQFKHKHADTASLKCKMRLANAEIRKAKRTQFLRGKRIRNRISESGTSALVDDEITPQQIQTVTRELQKKGTDRHKMLSTLRKGFAHGTKLIDAFLSVENAMNALIGVFSCSDPELQLDAAWCLTNMAAGTDEHSQLVLKQAGPYLTTYLSSGSAPLQEQCCWVVGNIAGDSKECRDDLRAMGVLPPLVNLLQHTLSSVIKAASFAVSNMARDKEKLGEFVDDKFIEILLKDWADYEIQDPDVVGEIAWVLTYISASGEFEELLLKHGVTDKLIEYTTKTAPQEDDFFHILTPCLRCLGNIFAVNDKAIETIKEKEFYSSFEKFLHSEHRHMKKESLWVLSNITVNKDVCLSLKQNEILPLVVKLMSTDVEVKKEAAYCVCNIASHGEEFCTELLKLNTMGQVVLLLQVKDSEGVDMGLTFLEMAFRTTENGVHLFEEAGGLAAIEALEYHENEQLREHTNYLLDNYLFKEVDKK